jgi:hypothetical protein
MLQSPGMRALVEDQLAAHMFSYIDMLVQSQPDPALALAILRYAGRENDAYLSLIHKGLGTDETATYRAIDDLLKLQLLEPRGEGEFAGVRVVPETKTYLQKSAEQFGAYLKWEALAQEEALGLITAALPHLNFSYHKNFELPLEDLGPLQKEMTAGVEALRAREAAFFIDRLALPVGSSVPFSFVANADPTWVDGAGRSSTQRLEARMNYATPREALLSDVDKAHGSLNWAPQSKTFIENTAALSVSRHGSVYSASVSCGLWPNCSIWRMPLTEQNELIGRVLAYRAVVMGLYPEKRSHE